MENIITEIMKEVENGSFTLFDVDMYLVWTTFLNKEAEEMELANEIASEIHYRYGFGY